MVFSSSLFLIWFLPVFLLAYFLIPNKYRNWLALFASIFFYSWGAPKFIFVILSTTFLDFHLVKWMAASKSKLHRRLLLTLSVSVNLGLLFYFKYSNFFIENFDVLLKAFGINGIHWSKLILPIGISFYTFETVTYVVDVYRRVQPPLTRFWDYQLYIILFPKLIAGPIVRYHEIADQIVDRRASETTDNRLLGMFRFIIGLAKKVLIANVLGAEVDRIFALGPLNVTTPIAWIGIIAYSFQIYYDFSGYSDMAIGIGKMIGFTFPENFNNPYISRNITEFWRRWHMTLGRWMKDYLYIPLGGSRVKTKARLFLNLWLVFLISGLWHGAAWNFVVWGGFHGLFLVLDRLFLIRFTARIGKIPSVILTYLITLVGWVLFRSTDLHQAGLYLKKMFSFDGGFPAWRFDTQFWVILLLAAFFGFFGTIRGIEGWQEKQLKVPYSTRKTWVGGLIAIILLVYCMASLTTSGFNPFIYFRF
ncbi:MAG: MBOAT family protein [Bacteroidia bacterium]|nr:MBOAT family protein [Bacteroidia bacterium]